MLRVLSIFLYEKWDLFSKSFAQSLQIRSTSLYAHVLEQMTPQLLNS